MSVEISASQEAQARRLAQKKSELIDQENALIVERSQAERKRLEEGTRLQERTEKSLVEISKAGEQQLAAAKKLNSDRLHAIDDNSKKAYEQLALTTAEELKRAEGNATGIIESHKTSSMEKIKSLVDRTEDPFYRVKTLAPLLREEADAFTVQVSLPPHEAENLIVSSDGHSVNLALSRRFQDKAQNTEGTTRTNSFQSIVEQVAMPAPYDAKKISRHYEDGVLTIRVPKMVMGGSGSGPAPPPPSAS